MAEAKILPLTRPSPNAEGRVTPGAEFGPYRLVRLLGSGGMGEVYLAKHSTLGREVAIKLLNPEAASHLDLVRRLFAEARIVNEINHENIVEIHDFISDAGGQSYYVMELLRGEDLANSRENGPFTIERALGIAVQICSALRAVHAKGVVHRDLKPQNVFLVDRAGQKDFVKLIDFGVAKVFDETLRNGSFTMAGAIVGTPEYMSPEQAGGRAVDGRSDIYSLGLILYWMLSDDLPFHGSGFDKLILARLTTTPAALKEPTPAGQRLPGELSRIVLRCLEREPADRFQTIEELSAALSQAKASLPPQAAAAGASPLLASPSPRLGPGRLAAIAVVVLAVLTAGGLWAFSRGPALPEAPAVSPPVATALPAVPPAASEPPIQHPIPEVALPPPPAPVSASQETPKPAHVAKHPMRPSKPAPKSTPVNPAPKRTTPAASEARPLAPSAKPQTKPEPKKLPPGIIDPFNE
jgi:serine/threonine-protein kinase